LPVFRFNKAFGIGRDVKVFLNLESGVMRGAVPDAEQHKTEQVRDLKSAQQQIFEQKKRLKSQRLEIFQLESELRAAKERAEYTPTGEPETGALPDFVIIGAQKSGTTSLYHLLARHPYVEPAATKELHYFDGLLGEGVEWYRRCFPAPRWKDGRRTITGEATPYYLFHPHAARRMAEVIPQARLIALLRNPVDRAYSHYHQVAKRGFEPLGFEDAIEAEEERLRVEKARMLEDEHYASFSYQRFSYLSRGIYVDQLLHWSKYFSDEQMLVLKSEDFFERTPETLKLVLDFLRLPEWEPESPEVRKRGEYQQQMNPATRKRLEEFFEPHNHRLYEYLGRDFGW
jgi:hypothetical protein